MEFEEIQFLVQHSIYKIRLALVVIRTSMYHHMLLVQLKSPSLSTLQNHTSCGFQWPSVPVPVHSNDVSVSAQTFLHKDDHKNLYQYKLLLDHHGINKGISPPRNQMDYLEHGDHKCSHLEDSIQNYIKYLYGVKLNTAEGMSSD